MVDSKQNVTFEKFLQNGLYLVESERVCRMQVPNCGQLVKAHGRNLFACF